MKHSSQPEYEVSGDLAEVETIDLLALIPPTLDGMTKALFVDLITRLAAIEERDREREEKLAAVEEEVSALREDNARKDERIAELERELFNHSLHGHPDMRLDIAALQSQKKPAPALRQSTAEEHVDRLFSEMRRLRMRQTTVRDAARFIGISKPHMQKLKPYLAADMRFTLLKDPNRPNRYLIRIV